jgi:hypothetical protein
MHDQTEIPRTAREALLIELLSDVGRVHDAIKDIPGVFKLSMSDSLEIIAQAVGDAETTAKHLQEVTNESIKATATRVAFEAGSELSGAIQQSLERTFEPALNRASAKIDALQKRVETLSGNIRDVHATRINYILLIGFVITLLSAMGAVSWLAMVSQDHSDTNKWFYAEYKAQRGIIESLPPDIKRKFDKK